MSAILKGKRLGIMAHLQLELFSHSILFVGFYDDMEIVKIFNDEIVPLVHRQKNLLDRRITECRHENAVLNS